MHADLFDTQNSLPNGRDATFDLTLRFRVNTARSGTCVVQLLLARSAELFQQTIAGQVVSGVNQLVNVAGGDDELRDRPGGQDLTEHFRSFARRYTVAQ